jgi:hypothetical protein
VSYNVSVVKIYDIKIANLAYYKADAVHTLKSLRIGSSCE